MDESSAPHKSVDVVIPAYNESPAALAATISACTKQSYAVSNIFVVDDGSRVPVSLPETIEFGPRLHLLRLPENRGISAARNAAIRQSSATFIACVNSEILPAPDWVEKCADYLILHPEVAACYGRNRPQSTKSLLTRWRLRFQEARFPEKTEPSHYAPGHAVLFRKSALDAAGGYDEKFRVAHEDSDITRRLWKHGMEVHFITSSFSVSIQKDTLRSLAVKQLRDSGWYSAETSSLAHLYFAITKWTLVRASRNVAKGRFYFLPVDAALWAYTSWLATAAKVRHVLTTRARSA
jgi:cellulose synthase/poly-beta-1,6-N-acetylglucosamine synthase-like glycosyltransferase